MSTTSRGTDFKRLPTSLFCLLIVINYAKATIDYRAIRNDTISQGTKRESARTTRTILEEVIQRNSTSGDHLQDGTEHLLQYGALLRAQILDTFGKLVYDHYDDFGMSQIEALYRVYRETLERKYNIFDIVPSVLKDPDTRPTKICAYINDYVTTCLKESSKICMSVNIHDEPHEDTLSKPALNVTREIYELAEISTYYPLGFSPAAVLKYLRSGRLRFTPALFSGLLHNAQYDSFDDKVRTAERELFLFLTSASRNFSKETETVSTSARSVSELLKIYLTSGEKIFTGKASRHAIYLAEHMIREVDAISENIEWLGTIYDNSTINLKYLFELILPNDTMDRDIVDARNYLLQQMKDKMIVEKYVRIEKYQQAGPDQLLMEIFGQLRDIHFAEDLVTSLYTHARFWHKSHMIKNLDELLELFNAYDNLRGVPEYRELLQNADRIKRDLEYSKNVSVELLCSRPRTCLRIGLEMVKNCAAIDEKTKIAIDVFTNPRCQCSCLEAGLTIRITNDTESDESMGEFSTPAGGETPGDIFNVIYNTTTESLKNLVGLIPQALEKDSPNDDDDILGTGANDEEAPTSTVSPTLAISPESKPDDTTEMTTEPLTVKLCVGDCSSIKCNDSDCQSQGNLIDIQCEGSDCNKTYCEGPDCAQAICKEGNCTTGMDQVDSSESSSCDGDDCEENFTNQSDCEGPECSTVSCEGDNCQDESVPESADPEACGAPECEDNSSTESTCKSPNCENSNNPPNVCVGLDCEDNMKANWTVPTGKTPCLRPDCPVNSCVGNDCKDNAIPCAGPNCSNVSCDGGDCPDDRDDSSACQGPYCKDDAGANEAVSTVKTPCLGLDCPPESCEGDNCKDNAILCRGPNCFNVSCEGGDCPNDPDNSTVCKGRDCENNSQSNKTGSTAPCEGPNCSSVESLEHCEGSDCFNVSCEGGDCPNDPDNSSVCKGRDCENNSQSNKTGSTAPCEGPNCSSVESLEHCEGSDCFNVSCEGGDCPNDPDNSSVCKGRDCENNSQSNKTGSTAPCEDSNCSSVESLEHCEGSDCSNVPETECEDGDCSKGSKEGLCQTPDCTDTGIPPQPEEIGCQGTNCTKQDCQGPDCLIKSIVDCEGPNCTNTNCTGPNCTEEARIDCEGPNCTNTNCTGPNCTEEARIDCEGPNCTNTNCTGPNCTEEARIDCEGPNCTNTNCTGPNCTEEARIDCEDPNCSHNNCTGSNCSGDCTITECETSDCLNNATSNCSGANYPKVNCTGPDCLGVVSNTTPETVCLGPDCVPIQDVCTGSDCSTETSYENCNGPDCPAVPYEEEFNCEGGNCSNYKCEGASCDKVSEEKVTSNGSTEDGSGDKCKSENCNNDKKTLCEGIDCPAVLTPAPEDEFTGEPCIADNCTTVSPTIEDNCRGANCTGISTKKESIGSEKEQKCEGEACKRKETKPCKGDKCINKLFEKGNGTIMKEPCLDDNCTIVSTLEVDCEGVNCKSNVTEAELKNIENQQVCEGGDCQRNGTKSCENDECIDELPERKDKTITKEPCNAENCTSGTFSPNKEIEKTWVPTELSVEIAPIGTPAVKRATTFCGNSDPHYRRQRYRLRKMRRLDALTSTPKYQSWNNLISPSVIEKISKTVDKYSNTNVNENSNINVNAVERIERTFDRKDQKKNPLLQVLGDTKSTSRNSKIQKNNGRINAQLREQDAKTINIFEIEETSKNLFSPNRTVVKIKNVKKNNSDHLAVGEMDEEMDSREIIRQKKIQLKGQQEGLRIIGPTDSEAPEFKKSHVLQSEENKLEEEIKKNDQEILNLRRTEKAATNKEKIIDKVGNSNGEIEGEINKKSRKVQKSAVKKYTKSIGNDKVSEKRRKQISKIKWHNLGSNVMQKHKKNHAKSIHEEKHNKKTEEAAQAQSKKVEKSSERTHAKSVGNDKLSKEHSNHTLKTKRHNFRNKVNKKRRRKATKSTHQQDYNVSMIDDEITDEEEVQTNLPESQNGWKTIQAGSSNETSIKTTDEGKAKDKKVESTMKTKADKKHIALNRKHGWKEIRRNGSDNLEEDGTEEQIGDDSDDLQNGWRILKRENARQSSVQTTEEEIGNEKKNPNTKTNLQFQKGLNEIQRSNSTKNNTELPEKNASESHEDANLEEIIFQRGVVKSKSEKIPNSRKRPTQWIEKHRVKSKHRSRGGYTLEEKTLRPKELGTHRAEPTDLRALGTGKLFKDVSEVQNEKGKNSDAGRLPLAYQANTQNTEPSVLKRKFVVTREKNVSTSIMDTHE